MQNERGLQRRIKKHIKAREHTFFAITHPGLENTALKELISLGINNPEITAPGGIEFTGRINDCYHVNICAGTVTRVLLRIASFKSTHFTGFKKKIMDIPWELFLSDGQPASYSITSRSSRLYHTQRIEQETQKGIIKRLEKFRKTLDPDGGIEISSAQKIFIRLNEDQCQLSLDTSGEPLYKRGYKILPQKAPIRETIAAAILKEAGLAEHDLLIDPMSGSGTFTLEAMLLISGVMPGLNRNFSFEGWPSFSCAAFNHIKKKLSESEEIRSLSKKIKIYCSDKELSAIEAIKNNIKGLRTGTAAEVAQKDFFKEPYTINPNLKALLVLNPPYGKRISQYNLRKQYSDIGETIRRYYNNCSYAIITPGIEYEKQLRLPWDKKLTFSHGGIRVGVLIKHSQR